MRRIGRPMVLCLRHSDAIQLTRCLTVLAWHSGVLYFALKKVRGVAFVVFCFEEGAPWSLDLGSMTEPMTKPSKS